MKSMHIDHSNLLRTQWTSSVHRQTRGADGIKAHTMADAVLIVTVVATILVLYAAMFMGLYRWSHYDPLLLPDNATVASRHTDVRLAAYDAGLGSVFSNGVKLIVPSVHSPRAAMSSM
jgi:hypothetical protein